MTLKVKFQKHEDNSYYDVSDSELIFSSDFMNRLLDAVEKKKNYYADVAGIHEVYTSSGRVDHAPFFLVSLNQKSGAFEFLFRILPGEESQLVGVHPEVEVSRLRTLVNQSLQKKSTEVRLYI